MEFIYYDNKGERLEQRELHELALWNPVMEHILAEIAVDSARKHVPLLNGEKM